MDAKITKLRLSRMLSYDWIKIIALAAAAILVWSLIFTMTATRITPAQQFSVFNGQGNVSLSRTNFYDLYEKAFRNGVFSHEVIETNVNDMADNPEYASTLMEARLGTDEGDIMFVPNAPDMSSSYKDETTGEIKYKYSQLDTLVMGYQFNLYTLDPTAENGYFAQMERYLDAYYDNGDCLTGKLNEEKVKADFRARIEKNKDKRYKKPAQIAKGEADDIARIQKYQAALVKFYEYLEKGYVSVTSVDIQLDSREIKGAYFLNICPETDKAGNPLTATDSMAEYVAHTVAEVDAETGETKNVRTAKNMHVAFFRLDGVEEGFQYESLLFLTYLLDTCIAEGTAK